MERGKRRKEGEEECDGEMTWRYRKGRNVLGLVLCTCRRASVLREWVVVSCGAADSRRWCGRAWGPLVCVVLFTNIWSGNYSLSIHNPKKIISIKNISISPQPRWSHNLLTRMDPSGSFTTSMAPRAGWPLILCIKLCKTNTFLGEATRHLTFIPKTHTTLHCNVMIRRLGVCCGGEAAAPGSVGHQVKHLERYTLYIPRNEEPSHYLLSLPKPTRKGEAFHIQSTVNSIH